MIEPIIYKALTDPHPLLLVIGGPHALVQMSLFTPKTGTSNIFLDCGDFSNQSAYIKKLGQAP